MITITSNRRMEEAPPHNLSVVSAPPCEYLSHMTDKHQTDVLRLVQPGAVMVSVLARKSRPFHIQVTTLGKLFTCVPLSPSSIVWYRSRGDDALRLGR